MGKIIITLKDIYGFYSHEITTQAELIKGLLYRKNIIPELWQSLQHLNDADIKKMSVRELVHAYFQNFDIIYISESAGV